MLELEHDILMSHTVLKLHATCRGPEDIKEKENENSTQAVKYSLHQ